MINSSLLALLFASNAWSGDWPQHLGPSRNGSYSDSDVVWPTGFAWQREVGEGFSAPVIAADKVILFHRRKDKEIVEAFEAKTGRTLWTFDYATTYKDDYGWNNGPRGAPSVADGRVYTYGAEGVLHAIDLETGQKIWRVDVAQRFAVPKGFFGAGCSPLAANGKLYLNIGGKGAGIAAFEAATGKLVWKSTGHEASYSSPVMAPFGAVFFTREGVLVADPETGAVTYELHWRSRAKLSANVATPLVAGNILFITANYGTGAVAIDFSKNPPVKLWSNDESLSSHYATPVIHDGYLYGFHGAANGGVELRAVELRTGAVTWRMTAYGAGSVTLLGGKLMFIRDDGQIFQINANPAKLEVLGNFKPLDGKIRSYPAIGAGLVCIRDAGRLACLK